MLPKIGVERVYFLKEKGGLQRNKASGVFTFTFEGLLLLSSCKSPLIAPCVQARGMANVHLTDCFRRRIRAL
jgi:hypothetical protein